MSHVARATCFVAVIAATACTSSTAPSLPTGSQTLHATVTDAVGDAVVDARVPVSPDLIRATADVAGGSLTLMIQFAPGTFDRQTTRVSVLLDTDQDGSTGIRQGDGIGADYAVDLAAATGQAIVSKANPTTCAARGSCFDTVGSTPVTLLTDAMQVTVPLSLLGNDDGRLNFQMDAYALVAPLTTVLFDFMPDNNLAPGRIQ